MAVEIPAYALISRTRLAEPRPGGGARVETEILAIDLRDRPLIEQAEAAERDQHPDGDVRFEWYPTGESDWPQELFVQFDDGGEISTGYLIVRATVQIDAPGGDSASSESGRDPVVLATPFEMVRAAAGHPMTLPTLHGGTAVLRIPTLDEYRQFLVRSAAWFEEHGLSMPDPPSDDQIRAALKPLPGGAR